MNSRTKNLKFKQTSVSKEIAGKLFFFEGYSEKNVEDGVDSFKHFLKKYKKLYRILKVMISPVCFDNSLGRFINKEIGNQEGCFINLGSGNERIHEKVVNFDIFGYDEVDIICDICSLPIEDNSVDVVFNLSVLEHVPFPQKVVSEIWRVLKPGGLVFSDVPFVMGFHASPYDYSRWTAVGIKKLYAKYDILDFKVNGGPTSAFLWIFQEWFAMLLSFGIKALYLLLHIFIMCLTFPIKFIDIILRYHPMAENIAASYILIGRKTYE
ncbi:MAG: class I SAM-dependent methyltransferase [Candidatus Omnitrophota bacterium]